MFKDRFGFFNTILTCHVCAGIMNGLCNHYSCPYCPPNDKLPFLGVIHLSKHPNFTWFFKAFVMKYERADTRKKKKTRRKSPAVFPSPHLLNGRALDFGDKARLCP